MENKCSIVEDLLPLYIDGIISEDGKCFVEGHLSSCDKCQKLFVSMNTQIHITQNNDEKESRESKKTINRYLQEVRGMAISIVLFVVSLLLFCADCFLIQYSWANMYDGVFRIVNIFLIPTLAMMLIAGICVIVFVVKKWKIKEKKYRLKSAILIIAFIIIVGSCTIFARPLSAVGFQIITLVSIISTETDDSMQHYLIINEVDTNNQIKIRCDEKIYNEVIVDENVLYTIEYRLNLIGEREGNLSKIDLSDYIDNRRGLQ